MAVVAYNEAEVKLLARLLRAEAEGEGQLGMLMVGNVGINPKFATSVLYNYTLIFFYFLLVFISFC